MWTKNSNRLSVPRGGPDSDLWIPRMCTEPGRETWQVTSRKAVILRLARARWAETSHPLSITRRDLGAQTQKFHHPQHCHMTEDSSTKESNYLQLAKVMATEEQGRSQSGNRRDDRDDTGDGRCDRPAACGKNLGGPSKRKQGQEEEDRQPSGVRRRWACQLNSISCLCVLGVHIHICLFLHVCFMAHMQVCSKHSHVYMSNITVYVHCV